MPTSLQVLKRMATSEPYGTSENSAAKISFIVTHVLIEMAANKAAFQSGGMHSAIASPLPLERLGQGAKA